MAVHLSNFNKSNVQTNLYSSSSFLAKNKIVINNPKQTHFSVEGVQSYTPMEIKAMKEREERLMQRKQGIYVQLKTVLLSDQLIQQNQDGESVKKTGKKQKQVKQAVKPKTRPKSRINPRNAVSTNNQAIIKIEKEIKVKNDLERKLEKLQKKYKQHFKDVDMKEGLENRNHNQQSELEDSQQYEPQCSEKNEQFEEKMETTTYQRTFGRNPRKSKISQSNSQEGIDEIDDNQSAGIMSQSLKRGFNLLTQCSSYSERLGTAVHDIFK